MPVSGPSGPNGEWAVTTPEYWARVKYPIIGFSIWYADGSVFRGTACEAWESAPRGGVLVLVVYHPSNAPTKRVVVAAKDEYTLPGQPGSKLGLLIDDETYAAIYDQAARVDDWSP